MADLTDVSVRLSFVQGAYGEGESVPALEAEFDAWLAGTVTAAKGEGAAQLARRIDEQLVGVAEGTLGFAELVDRLADLVGPILYPAGDAARPECSCGEPGRTPCLLHDCMGGDPDERSYAQRDADRLVRRG